MGDGIAPGPVVAVAIAAAPPPPPRALAALLLVRLDNSKAGGGSLVTAAIDMAPTGTMWPLSRSTATKELTRSSTAVEVDRDRWMFSNWSIDCRFRLNFKTAFATLSSALFALDMSMSCRPSTAAPAVLLRLRLWRRLLLLCLSKAIATVVFLLLAAPLSRNRCGCFALSSPVEVGGGGAGLVATNMTDEQITASAQSKRDVLARRRIRFNIYSCRPEIERESLAIVGCGFPLNCTSLELMDGRRARRGGGSIQPNGDTARWLVRINKWCSPPAVTANDAAVEMATGYSARTEEGGKRK